jgi:hypothetical protein
VRPACLLALLALGAPACLHAPVRKAAPSEPFALDDLSLRAPPEPGWSAEEGGAGGTQWIRFQRPAIYPAEPRQAMASQEPLERRPGSPADFLDQVQQEQREARGRVEANLLDLTRAEARLDDRYGPLTVLSSGRGVKAGAPRGREAVLFREYTFVLPERPDRRYRLVYLEVAPEWSPGAGFEERAAAFFAGAAVRRAEAPPVDRDAFRGEQRIAAGPAVARLRGLSFAGGQAQMSRRELLPARGAPGGLGVELSLDCFAGQDAREDRGAFSLAASALAVRSFGAPWLAGGLDLGYAALTHLRVGPRTDGVAFGPHLAAGLDRRLWWGALGLRLDLVAATPRYYRAGLLLGMSWGD